MTEVSIQQTVVVNYLIKLLLNVVKPINYGDLRFSKDPKTFILITRQTRRNTNYGVQTKPRIPTAVMMAGPVWELSNRLNPPAFLLASRERAVLGEEQLLPEDVGYYKYWRLKVTKSWDSEDSFHIKRIEMYGIPEDFDPDAPTDEEE